MFSHKFCVWRCAQYCNIARISDRYSLTFEEYDPVLKDAVLVINGIDSLIDSGIVSVDDLEKMHYCDLNSIPYKIELRIIDNLPLYFGGTRGVQISLIIENEIDNFRYKLKFS